MVLGANTWHERMSENVPIDSRSLPGYRMLDSSYQTAAGTSSPSSYSYFVRMINAKKKSEYHVRIWHNVGEIFCSPTALKTKLMESFPDDLPTTNFQVGYFEPPGNTKRWLIDERDLNSMYACIQSNGSSKVNLWCESIRQDQSTHVCEEHGLPQAKKKKTSSSTKREQIEEETDEIFQKLKKNHPQMQGPKLRLWAKLIQSGRYEDYDTPPQIPLITGAPTPAKPKKESIADALAGAATAVVKALQNPSTTTKAPDSPVAVRHDICEVKKVSPMKLASIRRSCLEDLKKLKELLEDGVLSDEEFAQEKRQILETLKSLK